MTSDARPLAIVTGSSSGIGYQLARICAVEGFDLVIASDEPEIHSAANELRGIGTRVDAVEADLSTLEGVDRLHGALDGRAVDALLANAGIAVGDAFLKRI